ncbi:hypothetical protein JCM21531_4114 [Acetivibrio straminisolvens JCM 21531]|uniref:Uncharacterized protein n=2 Tax=Acetivibrio straminisolvens TaxID=253314 RepID=W4VBC7_9FIRM|nr:hypothetical protein JCM21531_4114 [Acetivibrio straminisolvens JCM 21531]
MDDEEYRELIEELIECRYTSDKLKLIKDKVKSFDELEDVLLDAQLNEEEFNLLLNTLGDVELAAMIKRHPFESDIQAVDLSEEEQAVRLYLKNYMNRISNCRREKILQIAKHLV